MLENQSDLLDPSSLQESTPWDSSKQISEEAIVWSPEDHGCDPAFCLAYSCQDPKFHNLITTTAKAAPDFHISNQFFIVCKYQGQQSLSPPWLLENSWIACALLLSLQQIPGWLGPP